MARYMPIRHIRNRQERQMGMEWDTEEAFEKFDAAWQDTWTTVFSGLVAARIVKAVAIISGIFFVTSGALHLLDYLKGLG